MSTRPPPTARSTCATFAQAPPHALSSNILPLPRFRPLCYRYIGNVPCSPTYHIPFHAPPPAHCRTLLAPSSPQSSENAGVTAQHLRTCIQSFERTHWHAAQLRDPIFPAARRYHSLRLNPNPTVYYIQHAGKSLGFSYPRRGTRQDMIQKKGGVRGLASRTDGATAHTLNHNINAVTSETDVHLLLCCCTAVVSPVHSLLYYTWYKFFAPSSH